jgi:uncharacterized protein YkwD
MKKWFTVTGIAVSSVIVATGAFKIAASAHTASAVVKLDRQPLPVAAIKSPTYVAQTNNSLAAIEQVVHSQVNQHRQHKGLPALELDERITQQARNHSQAMANGEVGFGHDGFKGRVQEIAKVSRSQSLMDLLV